MAIALGLSKLIFVGSRTTRRSAIGNRKMENPLAPWRDLALVWLILWAMLFAAIPGIVLYFAQLYLRRFRCWLRTPLLTAQLWARRVEQGTQHASVRVAYVPITFYALGTRLHITARSVWRFVLGE